MSRLTEAVGVQIVYAGGQTKSERSEALCECELHILVNQGNLARLICTRTELKELVAGFLYTERIIDRREEIRLLHISAQDGVARDDAAWDDAAQEAMAQYNAAPYSTARVFLNRDLPMQPVPRTDRSCCTGNRILLDAVRKRPLQKITDLTDWTPADIFCLAGRFREQLPVHRVTDSTHSCLLMRHGKILFVCEDIGRHNALDKAIGYALLQDIPLSECIVYTSGRVPRDMVEKAVAAGIPVLVSKATPTAASVELASEYGLTLICRAWEDRYELFTD